MSLALGNVPSTDLVVMSSKGHQFRVEVKTVRKLGNSWLIKGVPRGSSLYYVLVVSRPKDDFPPPQYWVLTASEVRAILRKREKEGRSKGQILKQDVKDEPPGWEKLPDYSASVKTGF